MTWDEARGSYVKLVSRCALAACFLAVLLLGIPVLLPGAGNPGQLSALSVLGMAVGALGVLGLQLGRLRISALAGLFLMLAGTFGLLSLLLAYSGLGAGVTTLGRWMLEFQSLPLNVAGPFFFTGFVIFQLARREVRPSYLQFGVAVCIAAFVIVAGAWLVEATVLDVTASKLLHRRPTAAEIVMLFSFLLALLATVLAASDIDWSNAMMLVPQLAFMLVLASSFNLWMFLVEKEQTIILAETQDHAERLESALRQQQEERLAALDRMATRYMLHESQLERATWRVDAENYLSSYPELLGVLIVGPDEIVRWSLLSGSELDLDGTNFGSDSLHSQLLERARTVEQVLVSEPMPLLRGEEGVMLLFPLSQGAEFLGWMVVGVEMKPQFDQLVSQVAANFEVVIRYKDRIVFRNYHEATASPVASRLAVDHRFQAMGVEWLASLRPSRQHLENRLPWLSLLMLLAGILSAGLFGAALLQLGSARRAARRLADSERRFRLVAEQTGELIYDCNIGSGHIEWAGALEDSTGLRTAPTGETALANWIERIHPDDRLPEQVPGEDLLDERGRFKRHYRLGLEDRFIHVEDAGVILKDEEGNPVRMLGAIKNITQRLEHEAALRYRANHDLLTGLLSRERVMVVMQEMLDSEDSGGALVLLDIDRFRSINVNLGYDIGDELLKSTAARLDMLLADQGILARLGSDRFALFFPGDSVSGLSKFCNDLLVEMEKPFLVDDNPLYVSVTAGVACCPQDARTAEELFQTAELAVGHAKARGRNQLLYFDETMRGDAAGNLWIANRLRDALENEEFHLNFQPRVHLQTGRIIGMEALLRWTRPDGEVISPGRFIPVAEESGMIGPIGWYVVDAAADAALSLGKGLMQGRRIAINVSARQLLNRDFATELTDRVRERGAHPEWFEIELTETMLMQDPALAEQLTSDLHDAGFTVAIDDFGTGYSSLNYLKHLSLDFLKIDQSFVRGLPGSEHDAAIVRTIIGMAHGLKLTLIAEGIEEDAQREFLFAEGCEEGQGFLMARPVPLEELRSMLVGGSLKLVSGGDTGS
ncbi:MAG: EAL domain-containing protein [Gammaproteobacteria bacterium]|nr:EAL domain-containing protein [Gammaproteobacteria bacterium]